MKECRETPYHHACIRYQAVCAHRGYRAVFLRYTCETERYCEQHREATLPGLEAEV